MIYAKITDGVVSNLVVMEPAQARGDGSLVAVGNLPSYVNDLPVKIGDTYSGGHFYSDSVRVVTPLETLAGRSDNALIGKSLWACGDSLTAGFGLDPEPEICITLSYSYLAARRCGMTYHNTAIGGSTITYSLINNGDFYAFTNPGHKRYEDIAADTDYLSIYYGQNDYVRGPASARDTWCLATYGNVYSNLTTEQKAAADEHSDFVVEFIGEVGTLDVHTWIGAWETVFQWLMANRPATKTGIIVPELPDDALGNGMRSALMTACRTYGYPYLDAANRNLWLDSGQFPLYSADPIKVARKATYTSDDIHPNALGHEIQSVQFEGWLRSGFTSGGGGAAGAAAPSGDVIAADVLVLAKAQTGGIKLDAGTPAYPWRSINVDIRPDGSGENDPALATYYSILKGYAFAVGDQIWTPLQLPHDYAMGTDILLSIHWSHTSNAVTGGTVTFQADYVFGKAHGDAGGFGDVYATSVQSSAAAWYVCKTAEIALSNADGSGKINRNLLEPDGIILMRLILSANAMTGAQPDVFIHKVTLNYQSTGVGTHSRTPNFWA